MRIVVDRIPDTPHDCLFSERESLYMATHFTDVC